MKKIIFSLLILNFVFSINSFARKPAVEDFVGVESQDYQETPKGTEVVFNFGQHLNQYKKESTNISNEKRLGEISGSFGILAMLAFIALPILMWFGITKKTPQQTTSHTQTKPSENVANLSDYRNTDDSDDQKKAS